MHRLLAILLFALSDTALAGECDRRFQGIYTRGHEVLSFQPCRSKEVYWVSASTWIRGPLDNFLQAHSTGPYRRAYIEFRGQLLDESVGGFAVEYDGLVRISEIHRVAVDVPINCTEPSKPE